MSERTARFNNFSTSKTTSAPLEQELQTELHVARLAIANPRSIASVTRPKDQTIRAAGQAADGIAQVQPVEEVEDLASELNLIPLLDFEVLENREVYRRKARPVEAVALDRSVSAKSR